MIVACVNGSVLSGQVYFDPPEDAYDRRGIQGYARTWITEIWSDCRMCPLRIPIPFSVPDVRAMLI